MKNTMDRNEYIKEHIIWSLIGFLWYKNILFRCIPKYTFCESLFVFLCLSVILIGICIVITWKKNRNYSNIIENIILSWGIYFCIAYVDLYRTRIVYSGVVAAVVSLLLSMIVLFRRIKRRCRRKKIIKNRVEKVALLWKRNITIASLVVMIPVATSFIFYGTVLNSKVEVVKIYGDEHGLEKNIGVIANLEPSRWEKLDVREKLNVCQKIINCEARYYGLSHEIYVGIAELSTGTRAYYNDSIHQVVVDLEHIDYSYSYDVLESLLHEVHHAYQHEQVELYQKLDEDERSLFMFYDVSIYMEEFKNYVDGDEDFFSYYTQLTEINARKAGQIEALEYIKAINEYLGIELDVDMNEFSCLQEYVDYITYE